MAGKNIKKRRSTYRQKVKDENRFKLIKKTILLVIGLSALVVILTLLFCLFNQSEKLVKQKIDEIASDYYENQFYQSIANSDAVKSGEKTTEGIVKRYGKWGLDKITLHQFELYDNNRHPEMYSYINRYCDDIETYIFFYPKEPYGKTDYETKINYSCNF